ncbi:MAG TPA: 2-dehydropantoate 2-reductase [Geminicoccaceae bacterium]|nr:2-dehydropantoate 2-reductase [Geminicoccaceae bacterium]
MRIAMLGAGAMGGMFGARFARAGAEVVLYDRDAAHVAAIAADGLTVELPDEEPITLRLPAFAEALAIGTVDLAVVLVDCAATRDAALVAKDVIGTGGFALTLQNGIGNVEALVDVLGAARVVAGSTMNSAARLGLGRVAHTHLGKSVLGELDGRASERLERLAALFDRGGLPVATTDNIMGHVWQKFVLNAALNPVCAITRLRPGEVAESASACALVRDILREVLAVVAAEGIDLPDPDPTEGILGHAVGRMNKPSMLQHVEQGRRTEIAALNGALLPIAARHGIPCPTNRTIVQLVEAIQGRAARTA